jgi:hypothetical protein
MIFVRRFTTTVTITIAIIVTVGGATAIATAVGSNDKRAVKDCCRYRFFTAQMSVFVRGDLLIRNSGSVRGKV